MGWEGAWWRSLFFLGPLRNTFAHTTSANLFVTEHGKKNIQLL